MNFKYLGGPKNNHRFAVFDRIGDRSIFSTGLNHKPMTKAARMRFLNLSDRHERGVERKAI